MLRASDVQTAAEWFCGVDVTSPSRSRRVSQGKAIYWAALIEIGYSQNEVAVITGLDRSTIHHGLTKQPAQCWVDGVLERARKQVDAEDE
jgi:hypothetical protein